MTDDIQYMVALHAIGWLPGEDTPRLASALLEAGAASPALCELASWRAPTLRDSASLLDEGLRDECVQLPDRHQAVACVERGTVRRLATGILDPRTGAHRLWSLNSRGESEIGHEYVGVSFEWDDHPESREEIEAAIRATARRHWAALEVNSRGDR